VFKPKFSPGTGKTSTIVEAIIQLLSKNPSARILACAPSNAAADLVALRLRNLGKDNLFRFFASSRMEDSTPPQLLDFTWLTPSREFTAPNAEKVMEYQVVVTTCGSASFARGIGIKPGHFTHIFIDEAGQASEAEVMVAIKTLADSKTNVILSGDPKQLGPVIRSPVARQLGLDESYLQRLMKRDVYDVKLHFGVRFVSTIFKLCATYFDIHL
jgi:helicase MOV-10